MAGIEGTYTVTSATGVGLEEEGDGTLANGEEWIAEDDPEDPWLVTITSGEEGLTICNIAGWEEVVACTFDEATGILSVAAGAYVGDYYGYDTKMCGGLDGYTTADGIINYIDANGGYIYSGREQPIRFKLTGNKLELISTGIILYIDYYPTREDVLGYIYDFTTSMVMESEDSGVDSVSTDNIEAVEYFNLQGIRVVNPLAGQLLIKRQGATVVKTVIR